MTNLYKTNLYMTNLCMTNLYMTNLYMTNLYMTNSYMTNLYITIYMTILQRRYILLLQSTAASAFYAIHLLVIDMKTISIPISNA